MIRIEYFIGYMVLHVLVARCFQACIGRKLRARESINSKSMCLCANCPHSAHNRIKELLHSIQPLKSINNNYSTAILHDYARGHFSGGQQNIHSLYTNINGNDSVHSNYREKRFYRSERTVDC